MVNRILVAGLTGLIALSLPSLSRAATCTYTADQNADKDDDIVFRRVTTTGTSQYAISWCNPATNIWDNPVFCTSDTAGRLLDDVVINAGQDADRVRIISNASVSSSCGSISGQPFVSSCDDTYCTGSITVTGGTWNDHISIVTGESDQIDYALAFYGGSGNDCIDDAGSTRNSILWGGAGNDFVHHNGGSNAALYGDSPCSGQYCPPSGSDCVGSGSDFDLMDCGPQTDNYDACCQGTVLNCETIQSSCSCTSAVLTTEGTE